MASYLRSWLPSAFGPAEPADPTPSIDVAEPPPENDDDSDTETVRGGDDDDAPPAFPALHSAQRVGSQAAPLPKILSDAERMPPPPPPRLAARQPGVPGASSSLGVPGAPSSLGVPPGAGSLAPPLTTTKAPAKKSRKVALAPGHGPLDWANLKKSGTDLRGVEQLTRVTPSMLKAHNKRDDAWSAFNGKVYNITHYLPYHPGGEKELLRVAGRDGTKLFSLTHAWVNVDYMLDGCLVGFLVPES
ncbi:cytochrome b5 domain-containing protein [Phanerochaete sordida]|uniref:Cytochrome b5 domain-containing protein n=1 Tax=Phanerochaete sordida TaxID=48140 RepID=A0A9P3G652_9APHY|nr:cytochrome b5 domain-containing protein [Phanerochaete sordida]